MAAETAGRDHPAGGIAVAPAARRAAPYLLILPSLVLAAVILGYPVVDLVSTALHDVNRFGSLRGFNGGANFAAIWADPLFHAVLWRTLEWTVGVVLGTILVSLPVALILNQNFYGRGLARTIILLPWSVSLTMTAIVWRWALNGESGMINATLADLGMGGPPIVWLASAGLAFPAEVVIGILVSIPFTVTVFLGGLASLPTDIYEAARVDGATPWAQFRWMTLPLLRPFVNMAVVLNIIYVFNSFPIIWVLTQGGPANSTDILVTYLYQLAFRFGRLGDAAALSLVMLAILLVFTLVYIRLQMRERADAQA